MAILVGDRLRGLSGALAGIAGMCLPGGLLMFAVGIFYHEHGDHPLSTAALKGVAAAAVGLILATAVQLGKRSLEHSSDLVFVALTIVGVNRLHESVLTVLAVVGLIAILWYRPRKGTKGASRDEASFTSSFTLYSVGQMASGPNMMMIVSIGQWAGGILGAILVVIAFFGPTSLLTLIVGRLWNRLTKWPWRVSIQKGLAPVSIGLLLAGCFTLAKGAVSGLETAAIAVPSYCSCFNTKSTLRCSSLGAPLLALFPSALSRELSEGEV